MKEQKRTWWAPLLLLLPGIVGYPFVPWMIPSLVDDTWDRFIIGWGIGLFPAAIGGAILLHVWDNHIQYWFWTEQDYKQAAEAAAQHEEYERWASQLRGFVYVMCNASFPGQLKIGYTTRDPHRRAQELSTSGIPHPFEVLYAHPTAEPERLEQKVHARLRKYRVNNNREFFAVASELAISTIKETAVK